MTDKRVVGQLFRNTTFFLKVLFLLIFINGVSFHYAQSADCETVSNGVWSCGTPGSADDLFVNHSVTLDGGFNVMSSITIFNGGILTVSGNLQSQSGTITIKEGGKLIVEGGSIFTNNSNIQIEGGEMSVDGNMNLTGGTTLEMSVGSLLDVVYNMSINSNYINIDGTVNVGNNFNNNSDISGLGQINYNGSCLGSGSINESYSSDYCGSGSINMIDFSCIPSDNTPPVISNIPANRVIDLPSSDCNAVVNWTEPSVSDNCQLESFTSTHNPGDVFPAGTTTVTYTAKDKAGNTSQSSFAITLNDNIQPSLYNIPGSFTVNANPGECGAVVTWTEPSVTENCSYTLTSDHSPGDFFPLGFTNVTYIAKDLSGNLTHGSFSFEVLNSNPSATIDCPTDITSYLSADSCQVQVYWDEPSSASCWSNVTQSHSSGDLFSVGNHEVNYEYADASGNISTCSFNVNVLDTISPLVSNLPSDIAVSADPGTCGSVVNWVEPTASDNCSATLNSSHSSGDLFPLGETTVSYTATDPSGNSTTETFKVTVTDDLDPVLSNLPADISVSADPGTCGAVVNWVEPTASDNCSSTLNSSHSSGDLFPFGETIVSYTAVDPSGNSTTETFKVTVTDDLDPVLSNLPVDIAVSADPGTCGSVVNWVEPTASDNCSATLNSSHSSGDLFPLGETTVSYTATDPSGNSTTETFKVTVTDDLDPVLSNLPADISVSADPGTCGAVVNWVEPTASDNCSATLNSSHSSGDLFPFGETIVSYTAVDPSGNSTTESFKVTVTDDLKPSIHGMPSNIEVQADGGSCGAIVTWLEPTASDNCAVTLSSDFTPSDFFPLGKTTVTYSATDPSGNLSEKSFVINVVNTDAPTFTECPSDVTLYLEKGECEAKATWTEPGVVGCNVTLAQSHSSGDLFSVGNHEVKYEYTNSTGASSVCTFNVIVLDTISPEFTTFPGDIKVSAEAQSCTGTANWNEPKVADKCSEVQITSSHSPNDAFPIGETVVKYTATDKSGNTTKRSFTVTVEDKMHPVFSFCPTDFTIVSIDSNNKSAVVSWEEPVAEDACTGVTMNSSHSSGGTFAFGLTTVVFTATDESGNESQCSLEIEVQPDINQAPVVDDIYLVADAGESIDITLNASDPDGDQLSLILVENNENSSFISNIDDLFLSFTYTSYDDFRGTDTVYVVVEDNGTPKASSSAKVIVEINKDDEIKTSSVITINGDHLNDVWVIENIELFPDNKVQIYDRMGSSLFSASGYDNNSVVWDGSVQQSGNMAPTGTYFYVIDPGDGSKVLSGAIEVIR